MSKESLKSEASKTKQNHSYTPKHKHYSHFIVFSTAPAADMVTATLTRIKVANPQI